MGHKFDTIFHANRKELGLIEVGKKIDQTKEMKDGLVKMLIVMHDMLINLATTKEFLRKVKVVGRVINGKRQLTFSMMLLSIIELLLIFVNYCIL